MSNWTMVSLEQQVSRRFGLPEQLPVPTDQVDATTKGGLQPPVVRQWIASFLQEASGPWRRQNAALSARYDAFLAKAAHLTRAEKAFASRDFAGALKALRLVSRLDPEDHAVKLNTALALASQGELAEALSVAESIRETFQGDADFHVNVGNLKHSLGDREGATEEFVLALEGRPDCRDAMRGLEQLGFLQAVYEDPLDASSLIYVRTDALVEHLTRTWNETPRDAPYFLRQIGYHEREKHHEVVAAAARAGLAQATGEERRPFQRALCGALRALGQHEEACSSARESLLAAPEDVSLRLELAQCLQAMGRRDEAEAELTRALESDPGDQLALYLRFWPPTEDLEQLQAAVPSLEAFAQGHPEVAGAWRSLARAKIGVGDLDAALALFKQAVGLEPDDDDLRAEWWSELGKAQRYEQVAEDAARLGDMSQRDWQLRWGEAEALRALGRKTEAQAAFAAINHDESLHVDVRKRAKRAAQSVG